jgi:AmmeMemoRadiSam system protein B
MRKITIIFFVLVIFFIGLFLNKKNTSYEKVYHYSYFSQPEFYEQAYLEASKIKLLDPLFKSGGIGEIGGLVINHHLLAGQYIAEGFNTIATTEPVTVLLISPNHFSMGRNNVLASAAIWKTPFGELKPDKVLINNLAKQKIASIEEQPFEQEHGVSGIVAFIKKSLPNAKVVPIVVKDRVDISQAKELAENIIRALPQNAIIVGSFDFSHYLPSLPADFHDEVSLAAMENFDFNQISRLDIDSRPGLALFLKLLSNQGFEKFNLLRQNNSAKLAQMPDTLETTSYITGYFTKGKAKPELVFSLLALGQIENSTTTASSLNRKSPNFSIEFLERLFYGQEITTAFVNKPDKNLENLLNRFSINHPVYTEELLALGNIKIGFSPTLEGARKQIDNGAVIAISNGKHINLEQYKGKIVINSLGELLTQNSIKENTQSLAVGFVVRGNSVEIFLLPIGLKNGEGKLLVGQENDIVLAELAANSKVPKETKEQIRKGLILLTIND